MSEFIPSRRRTLQALLAALAVPLTGHSRFVFAEGLPQQPGHVLFLRPQDADYAARRQIFNKRITTMPRLLAVCRSALGVQAAMQYATAQNLPVSVKSGGHCFEGFGLNGNGLTIDLSLMTAMNYSAARGLVTEPGARLGNVYEYLAGFKRLIPAGSCAGVGVAGLTLGGGYGFFSRRLGLTCDSLTRVQMVDGRGRLLDSDTDKELLWACRGGNNGNVGIVTELTFRTHPAPATFTHYRFKYRHLDLRKLRTFAERWFHSMPQLPDSCYSSFVLGPTHLTILVTDTDARPAVALQGVLRRLGLEATEVQAAVKDNFLRGVQRFRGGVNPMYFKNVSAGYYQGFAEVDKVLPRLHELMKTASLKQNLLQINTLGGAIARGDAASAAYPHRSYPYLGEFQVYYERAADTPAAEKLVAQAQHEFLQSGINAHYCNYPDVGIKNWQRAYYGDAYPRLQALKRKLDPDNRLQHAQSVVG